MGRPRAGYKSGEDRERLFSSLCLVDFQIDCARRACFDPLSAAMNDTAEMSGPSGNGETWLRIL